MFRWLRSKIRDENVKPLCWYCRYERVAPQWTFTCKDCTFVCQKCDTVTPYERGMDNNALCDDCYVKQELGVSDEL